MLKQLPRQKGYTTAVSEAASAHNDCYYVVMTEKTRAQIKKKYPILDVVTLDEYEEGASYYPDGSEPHQDPEGIDKTSAVFFDNDVINFLLERRIDGHGALCNLSSARTSNEYLRGIVNERDTEIKRLNAVIESNNIGRVKMEDHLKAKNKVLSEQGQALKMLEPLGDAEAALIHYNEVKNIKERCATLELKLQNIEHRTWGDTHSFMKALLQHHSDVKEIAEEGAHSVTLPQRHYNLDQIL